MPTFYSLHGRIVELRRYSNVHQLYGHRPLGPSDRYEIWIKPSLGQERKFTINTRTMPARRGHEVSLILTTHRVPRVVGLGNWTTIDAVNYVSTDAPPLLRVRDIAVLLLILGSLVGTLAAAGASLFVPAAIVYLAMAAMIRAMARKRLAWQVNWAIDFEAGRTGRLTQTP